MLFKEIDFEREYYEKLIDVLFNQLNPRLTPCPNLGCDIVKDSYPLFFSKLSNSEVESWIIDKY